MSRQTNKGKLLLSAIIGVLVCTPGHSQPSATATSTTQGSVCIASVPPPAPGEKSLANPAGGNVIKAYSIKIDDLPPLRGLPDASVAVPPLPLDGRHVVRIFGDGKQVASFHFYFGDYSTNELCLTFDDFYEMWALRNCEDAGAWCACRPRHRLPWVAVSSCTVVGKRVVPGPLDRYGAARYFTEYQIRYVAEGGEFERFVDSGLPPSPRMPSADALRTLPKDCSYTIRYHPGMPGKAEVSRR